MRYELATVYVMSDLGDSGVFMFREGSCVVGRQDKDISFDLLLARLSGDGWEIKAINFRQNGFYVAYLQRVKGDAP